MKAAEALASGWAVCLVGWLVSWLDCQSAINLIASVQKIPGVLNSTTTKSKRKKNSRLTIILKKKKFYKNKRTIYASYTKAKIS